MAALRSGVRSIARYGLPFNDDSRSSVASVLVSLRKLTTEEEGCDARTCSEMAILDCAIRSHVPGLALPFADAAAISATFLATSGTC